MDHSRPSEVTMVNVCGQTTRDNSPEGLFSVESNGTMPRLPCRVLGALPKDRRGCRCVNFEPSNVRFAIRPFPGDPPGQRPQQIDSRQRSRCRILIFSNDYMVSAVVRLTKLIVHKQKGGRYGNTGQTDSHRLSQRYPDADGS